MKLMIIEISKWTDLSLKLTKLSQMTIGFSKETQISLLLIISEADLLKLIRFQMQHRAHFWVKHYLILFKTTLNSMTPTVLKKKR